MDWPKAKMILITSFLLVDLYLAWLLWGPQANLANTILTNADVQGLVSLCQHYGVELKAMPSPLEVQAAPNLSLVEQFDGAATAERYAFTWLGDDASAVQSGGNSFSYSLNGQTLRVIPGRFYMELHLDLPVDPSRVATGSQDAGVKLAEQFLIDHLGALEAELYQPGMVLAGPEQGAYVVELNRLHGGLPLFTDFYRVYVRAGQVSGFLARQSELDPDRGRKNSLVTADRPIKRYLVQVGMQTGGTVAVLDFRLGYGFESGNQQTLQPVWRLMTTLPGHEEVIFPAGLWYWGDDGQ